MQLNKSAKVMILEMVQKVPSTSFTSSMGMVRTISTTIHFEPSIYVRLFLQKNPYFHSMTLPTSWTSCQILHRRRSRISFCSTDSLGYFLCRAVLIRLTSSSCLLRIGQIIWMVSLCHHLPKTWMKPRFKLMIIFRCLCKHLSQLSSEHYKVLIFIINYNNCKYYKMQVVFEQL